jgi:hypothetical protein
MPSMHIQAVITEPVMQYASWKHFGWTHRRPIAPPDPSGVQGKSLTESSPLTPTRPQLNAEAHYRASGDAAEDMICTQRNTRI